MHEKNILILSVPLWSSAQNPKKTRRLVTTSSKTEHHKEHRQLVPPESNHPQTYLSPNAKQTPVKTRYSCEWWPHDFQLKPSKLRRHSQINKESWINVHVWMNIHMCKGLRLMLNTLFNHSPSFFYFIVDQCIFITPALPLPQFLPCPLPNALFYIHTNIYLTQTTENC